MSVPHSSRNIAARMGRWSASHRKLAIFGWLAFVLSAVVIGTAVGQKTLDQHNNNVGQAHRADQILKQAGFTQSGPLTEYVVVQNHKLTVHDPAFQAVVRDVVSAVSPSTAIHNLRSPLDAANRDQVSARRAYRARRVGHERHAEVGGEPDRPADQHGRVGGQGAPEVLRRRGRRGQLRQGADQDVQPAARPGREPARCRSRCSSSCSCSARCWRRSFRSCSALQSVVATIGLVAIVSHLTPMDQSVSAVVTARRPRRRRRLLAVLSQARARGAGGGPR